MTQTLLGDHTPQRPPVSKGILPTPHGLAKEAAFELTIACEKAWSGWLSGILTRLGGLKGGVSLYTIKGAIW